MPYKIGNCLLRRRLREAKMTQAELARRSGINPSLISDYVNNRFIMGLEAARIISEIVDCDITELYEWARVSRRE